MKINVKQIQELEERIERMEQDLDKAKDRLHKLKPRKPITHEINTYDQKNKTLITSYEYWCPYCGERIYKPFSKSYTKHKCNQMIDWT